MEAGRFSEALEEFSSCLEARKAVLPADSRCQDIMLTCHYCLEI